MRRRSGILCVSLAMTLAASAATAQKKATDIRPNHWATQAVQQVLDNSVMGFTDGTNFRGEAKVTRTQAVVALAKLARALEARQWRAQKSATLSEKTAPMQVVDTTQPLTRYTFAVVLSRFGNYLLNGVPRPRPNSKDLSKSSVLPEVPRITLPATDPAYASLDYLAKKRMIWPGSPLLKPDNKPVQGTEVSRALAEIATGLTNLWTDLGKDENGETPDKSFRNRPKKP
jgi:hypothetical protein